MSDEMQSQESDHGETDQDTEFEDDEELEADYDDYYENTDADDTELDILKKEKLDPEYFEFELFRIEDVERMLNEAVEAISQSLQVTPGLAKQLLQCQGWEVEETERKYRLSAEEMLIECKIKSSKKPADCLRDSRSDMCLVCMAPLQLELLSGVACGHRFCQDCWEMHFQVQINMGISTEIECMAKDCDILVPEDFVLQSLTTPSIRDKFQRFSFKDQIERHPELRFCPGPNCPVIVRAKVLRAKRVICSECNSVFCFKCGLDYHAPTNCDTIKKWLTKCADDSETANYISANTKDCPKCHVCIEKNGGCNHMQCAKCKHDFCWMCLGDWKTHGSEYYECSRYKENPNIANESAHAQAREALKKYLFYFERWENHAKSLKLEEETMQQIKDRIQKKVMSQSGTWIDWQYLLDAAILLRRCRYSLQYTYPYAYYLGKCSRKQLFEYQQAQLEAEVEKLSWKVERAEISDRGALENQMDIAEKQRLTLVQDFLKT